MGIERRRGPVSLAGRTLGSPRPSARRDHRCDGADPTGGGVPLMPASMVRDGRSVTGMSAHPCTRSWVDRLMATVSRAVGTSGAVFCFHGIELDPAGSESSMHVPLPLLDD